MSRVGQPAGRHVVPQQLLKAAIGTLNHNALSEWFGMTISSLERWARRVGPFTLDEKASVALGVLAIAPVGSRLSRDAARLRIRVCAELEYALGVTTITTEPPKIHFGR